MRKLKKAIAMLLSGVMALTMAAPAFAEESSSEGTTGKKEVTYTITAPDNTHTYEIYQIFTGDYANGILSNVKWGQNAKNDTAAATAGDPVPDTVLKALTDVNGKEATNASKLNEIEKYVDLNSEVFGTLGGEDNEEGTSKRVESITVPSGYYLIKDKDGDLAGKDEVYTTYIVQVAGDVTITPKADKPTSEKKVQDKNDSSETEENNWQDSADYDIGDKVPFKLSGKVANNYDAYETYQFIFHDKESEGLTFDKDSVTVKVDSNVLANPTGGAPYYEVVTDGLEDNCTFEVRFADLKKIQAVKDGSVITVEYESTLNDNAIIGAGGNPNEMHLEYSNNPNNEQGGETGKTPDDKVTVFTFKAVINKVDGDQEPLAGAEFTLKKKVPVSKEHSDGWDIIAVVKNENGTTFTATGLDDGEYILEETTTPAGYNTIAPIRFKVEATHDTTNDDPKLTELEVTVIDENGNPVTDGPSFTVSKDDGTLTTKVVNKTGAELPETGGMGTTIFYILGGVLMVGAAVLLIARRRMNAEQ